METKREKQQLTHLERISSLAYDLQTAIDAWKANRPDWVPDIMTTAYISVTDLLRLVDEVGGMTYVIESGIDEENQPDAVSLDDDEVDVDAVERTSTLFYRGE